MRAFAILSLAACTNVGIYIPIDPDAPEMRAHIDAEVCAPPAVEEDVPYKITFVIDKSLSNIATDEEERRVEAYYNAVNTFAEYPNVEFAVIVFNDQAHRPTLTYTRDGGILGAVGASLGNEFAEGGTNYEDTITALYDLISDDIDATDSAVIVRKTHYLVYWLSDGLPTFGISDPYTLTANIAAVREFVAPKVAEFRLDTLYLEPPTDHPVFTITEEEIAAGQSLLRGLADAGGGTFTNVASGQEFDFEIEVEQQLRVLELVNAVAVNRNARLGPELPRADSDGDGLTDLEEDELGTDDQVVDSDGDGFTDGVEVGAVFILDPAVADEGCTAGELDTDDDGLRDCEEILLGTDRRDPDTDGDELPDGLEVLMGSSPLAADDAADRDLDGYSDRVEVITHLEPGTENGAEQMERWGYRYSFSELIDPSGDRPCYHLRVDNIGLARTRAGTRPGGAQSIELFVAFRAADDWSRAHLFRAERRAGYRWPDYREPANGRLSYNPEDFVALDRADGDGEEPVESEPPEPVEPEPELELLEAPAVVAGESDAAEQPLGTVVVGGCRTVPRVSLFLLALVAIVVRRRSS